MGLIGNYIGIKVERGLLGLSGLYFGLLAMAPTIVPASVTGFALGPVKLATVLGLSAILLGASVLLEELGLLK